MLGFDKMLDEERRGGWPINQPKGGISWSHPSGLADTCRQYCKKPAGLCAYQIRKRSIIFAFFFKAKARRGERLKKEHLDSAMEGVTYSGVSKTLNCLCVWSCICIYRWRLSTSGWPTTSGREPFRSLSQYKPTISPNCCLCILIQGVSGWQTGGGGEGYRYDGILNSCAFVCNCACTHVLISANYNQHQCIDALCEIKLLITNKHFIIYCFIQTMPNGTYERIKKFSPLRQCWGKVITDNRWQNLENVREPVKNVLAEFVR